MLNESDHIDKLFADYLGDFEEKAPDYLWYNIQADLHNQKRLKRNSRIRTIAASIALFMTFGLGYISSDLALKNKYQANYLSLNSMKNSDLQSSYNRINNNFVSENDLDNEKSVQNKSKLTLANNESQNQRIENNTLLYKIFDSSKKQFLHDSTGNNNLKKNYSSSSGSGKRNSNQLLIDTLLFEEGNLPEGGFLLFKKTQKNSRWSFGTKFSPVYSMSDNPVNEGDNNMTVKSAIRNEKPNTEVIEKALLSYSGGLNVNYRFALRWSVESGIYYSRRKLMSDNLIGSSMNGFENEMVVYTPEGVKQLNSDYSSPALETSMVIGSSRDETFYSVDMNYISNFEYLELPIILRYRVIDRKLGFDILSGISTDFLIGNQTNIVKGDINLWSGQTQEISPLLYNATIGLGLNYNFYQSFSFNLEPTFKYSLIQSESTAILKYPYSFAVFAGFSYRFK